MQFKMKDKIKAAFVIKNGKILDIMSKLRF